LDPDKFLELKVAINDISGTASSQVNKWYLWVVCRAYRSYGKRS
jgi:hypothetical protein